MGDGADYGMDGDRASWTVTRHRPNFIRQMPDIWLRRRLIRFFLRRAIVDLYAQTVLGVTWLIIRPAITVVTATLVFGNLLGVSTYPVPYLLFALTGMAAWIVFDRGLVYGTKSILRNRQIMRQFYFPRAIVHLTAAGPALVEGLFVFAAALAAMGYFAAIGRWTIPVGWYNLLAIPSVLLVLLFVLGVSMVTSVLNSHVRDTQYGIRYASGVLMLITPVFYPVASLPETLQFVMWFNPLTPMMEMFRWAIFHVHEPRWEFVALSAATTLLTTGFGLWFFIRWEASALDAR